MTTTQPAMPPRTIAVAAFRAALDRLLTEAQYAMPADIGACLRAAAAAETAPLGRDALEKLVDNERRACDRRLPLCQDTGIPHVFLDLGPGVALDFELHAVVAEVVSTVYDRESLRRSGVVDPLARAPGVHPYALYVEMPAGTAAGTAQLSVLVRGGGSENMSETRTFLPTDGARVVAGFIVDTTLRMLTCTCPPVIVGVGIGGSVDRSAYLAKRSLLRTVGSRSPLSAYAGLESELLARINASGIGPLALGGALSAIEVFIETAPAHIATPPVSLTLQCHAVRRGSVAV